MKIRKAISLIKSDNRSFSDDSMLTNRFIWSKIQNKTNLFLKQKNDRFQLNNKKFLYSTLNCIEMELVNSIDCCKEIPSCKILKSKKKIPKIIDSNVSTIMGGIYTVDSGQKIDFITINDVIRLSNSKYKPTGIKAFVKNDYIYIPFRDNPKLISMEAYFEDPFELEKFNSCNNTSQNNCVNMLELEWKCPSDLQDSIIQEVNKDLAYFYNRLIADENTDKNESSR